MGPTGNSDTDWRPLIMCAVIAAFVLAFIAWDLRPPNPRIPCDHSAAAANCEDVAKETLAASEYQSWAFWWQAAAATGAFVAASIAAGFAWYAIGESRRVGEAQTRAYVSIASARVDFLTTWVPNEAHPRLTISFANSGQSPARDVAWRPTLQYISGSERRTRGIGDNWAPMAGTGLQSAARIEEGMLIADMAMVRFARTNISPSGDVLVRLRVEFSFVDVFDRTVRDEAYFAGVTARLTQDQPPNVWRSIDLGLMHRLEDWETPGSFHDQ